MSCKWHNYTQNTADTLQRSGFNWWQDAGDAV